MSATSAAPSWLEFPAEGAEAGREAVSRLRQLTDAVRAERRKMLFGDTSNASTVSVTTVVARAPITSARAELVGGMTTTALRTMLVEVVREEVSMHGRKNSKAQHASAVIEVSDTDRAAARALARRMGLHVRESKR